MSSDLYAELYLWNKDIDALLRVLERIEQLRVCPLSLLRAYHGELEALRSSANVEFLKTLLAYERIEQVRTDWQRKWRELVASAKPTH